MRFDIITIFPKMFSSYLNEGVLARAQKKNIIKIVVHDLRDFTSDKRKTVDDTTYGGGPGMVMKIEPIYRVLCELGLVGKCGQRVKKKKTNTKIIIMSAKGNRFCQRHAVSLLKYDRIVLICGRYEGIDERVSKHLADEEISIGEYVLTGGEVPAMVVVDAVSRLVKGVVGNRESILDESFSKNNYVEYPHYTKPESFSPCRNVKWDVPKILLSGNHLKIKEWREKKSKSG